MWRERGQALMTQRIPQCPGRVIVAAAQERAGGLLDEYTGCLCAGS